MILKRNSFLIIFRLAYNLTKFRSPGVPFHPKDDRLSFFSGVAARTTPAVCGWG